MVVLLQLILWPVGAVPLGSLAGTGVTAASSTLNELHTAASSFSPRSGVTAANSIPLGPGVTNKMKVMFWLVY